jgi:hypothetical protein
VAKIPGKRRIPGIVALLMPARMVDAADISSVACRKVPELCLLPVGFG